MNRVARRISNFYGRAALSCLVEDLRNKVAMSEIALRMKVTRQRVHQWKNALGHETVAWEPYDDVVEVMDGVEEANRGTDKGGAG